MKTELIPFHEHSLITVRDGQTVLVAMRPICEAIGLDWSSQVKRINRHPVMGSTVVIMTTVAEDGKKRETITIPLSMLNGWLCGIDANRVKPELQATVIDYQKHCFDVLYQHFFGKPAVQHEKYWFAKNPHWVAIRELALQGLTNKAIGNQLSLSAGRISRAIRRMIDVGLIDPAKHIAARFKAATARRMMQLSLCLTWGV